jgi:hypothetical protein
MTDSSRATNDTADLREAITALTLRLDRIEAQGAQPSALDSAQARLTGAWDALRGGVQGPAMAAPASPRRNLLWSVLTVFAVLIALILAVDLVEEVFDGSWSLGRWID